MAEEKKDVCDLCGEKFDTGETKYEVPKTPGDQTPKEIAHKECYLEEYKVVYPDADVPKL